MFWLKSAENPGKYIRREILKGGGGVQNLYFQNLLRTSRDKRIRAWKVIRCLTYSRCRLHIPGAAYILTMPLTHSWCCLHIPGAAYIFPVPLIHSRCRLRIPGAAYGAAYIFPVPGVCKRHRIKWTSFSGGYSGPTPTSHHFMNQGG